MQKIIKTDEFQQGISLYMMIKSKKILAVFILTFICIVKSNGQIGIKTSFLKPSGASAYFFIPNLGIDIFWQTDDLSDKFVREYGISFYYFKPIADTIKVYGFYKSNNPSLLPGYAAYSNYYSLGIYGNLAYYFTDNAFSPFVAGSLGIHQVSYNYENSIHTISTQSYSFFTQSFSITPEVGIRYYKDRYSCKMGIAKQVSIDTEAHPMVFWKNYISFVYYFN